MEGQRGRKDRIDKITLYIERQTERKTGKEK